MPEPIDSFTPIGKVLWSLLRTNIRKIGKMIKQEISKKKQEIKVENDIYLIISYCKDLVP